MRRMTANAMKYPLILLVLAMGTACANSPGVDPGMDQMPAPLSEAGGSDANASDEYAYADHSEESGDYVKPDPVVEGIVKAGKVVVAGALLVVLVAGSLLIALF